MDIIKNFIRLYKKLIIRSPHLAVHNFRCENSDYSDQLVDAKNAYCCFNGYDMQDCYYTYDSRYNRDCTDLSYSNKCELCYSCIDCDECYDADFCQDCEKCADCQWCYACFSSRNCFGCVGIRHGEFQIFNKKYGRGEFEKKLKEIRKWPEEKIRARVEELRGKHPHVSMRIRRSEDVFGDYIFDSKNVFFGFNLRNIEDSCYAYDSRKLKDCVDSGMLFKSELIYEAIEATDNYNCNFMYWCANCRDCEYIMYCFDCENCFGCFNLQHKKYYILDEPYEKKEYFKLVSQIKNQLRLDKKYCNFLPDCVL